ncbi:hypothetical protein ANN_19312 [Periplaneta americana]|uniref:Uncharacterized protein n=1 Tax=Periplaneta americana TaxID=6978 RepID=A0ABQ8S9J3_PERAM|nr:hypothetical protein ANN_19312 [Periplaneta americana]
MKERFETKYGDSLSKEFEISCYQISCPQEESTTSSSISVLSAVRENCFQRVVSNQREGRRNSSENQVVLMNLYSPLNKWGCDGSSGHNEFKQKLADGDSFTDSEIFLVSFVPLLLYSEKDDKTNTLYCENPRPSSTKYCRPINIKLKHETIEIKHELKMTMVDGEVCNTVMENKSAQVCYICGASPKHMNDIDSVQQRTVDHKSFSFGLSILHAWIRFLECLLHVAYRLDFKKWQARGKDNEIMTLLKESIQKSFRAKMGLIIDRPKPGGSGTSNDGNTARRFLLILNWLLQ